ncbi:MAG: hypothetical protein A3F26_02015 [Candidatus Ryanbacteria bacterium RIFCSPHIGHO2_12_FULL_47_12b]|uniref:F5/8 type C domain-containing protein n=3 Tax=Parcubacteria group TaxID=1794811 RepID=A0A1G2H4Y1_9BACT|nr:MAG: F5/8 type C domain-containing protein [Parcubacteria group bacterium GW2011_GWA2_47_10b]KKU85109.1 MAG: F5/8 type C domain-containing protein [Parcubacteria group bacterium GW2011_GWA1_47_9]OGZ45062.1 MAG: hypothetical protein A2844_02665 [Candidatus Ryanbacteria bacterium RIFCSPHIGHO2_01_FULL_48_80]OGZ48753.1 MAG: hypothetical protein A3C83_00660 [Candidatus Ryanbacteria bacterium RIFCSPHIGHO2_02_FULL_47_25]OGZ52251.1 MAG: hypothetical protein A3A29_00515 [Candidatus Ryanbacteria bacte
MKRTTLFFLFFLGAYAFNAYADFDRALWQFKKRIEGVSSPGFVLLDLDEEVFNGAKENFSDIRIVSDNGGEVPFTFAPQGDRSQISNLPARMFDLSFREGESTEFTVDLGSAGQFHNNVTIGTPSENFRRVVEIEGSNDASSWRTLTKKGQIFDFTVRDERPAHVEDTTIDYPESTVRYLRVKILDHGEDPLRVEGVTVSLHVNTAAKETVFQPEISAVENSKDQATEIIADLGGKGIPTRRARFSIGGENFNRRVDVSASNDRQSGWRFVGSGVVFRTDTSKFQGENIEFYYPETQTQFLKFSIYNRDDQPLDIRGLQVFGVVRTLVFNASEESSYTLFYGNTEARRPQYDIERLFPYLEEGSMSRVSLGPQEKNSDYSPPLPPLTERNKFLLPTALGVIVAILAFLLLRLFTKKIEPLSDGPKV